MQLSVSFLVFSKCESIKMKKLYNTRIYMNKVTVNRNSKVDDSSLS